MKSCTITLGEKPYVVTQLPLRKNVAWQRKVAEHAKPILTAIPSLVGALSPIIKQDPRPAIEKMVKQPQPVDLADRIAGYTEMVNDLQTPQPPSSWLDRITDETLPALLDSGSNLLLGAIDAMPILLDLILEFDEPLNLDRERIEAEVTEEELLAAFVEIVKMSFPFGAKLGDFLRAASQTTAASGVTIATTSPTSPSASGDAGMIPSKTSRLPA
jgi:hypothetical protein